MKGGQDNKKRFLAFWPLCALSGNNSAVECDLAKVEVAGSNPVSRSKRRRSQVVRRRSAKPLFTGSNPVAASK
jgi:hypothetical protein